MVMLASLGRFVFGGAGQVAAVAAACAAFVAWFAWEQQRTAEVHDARHDKQAYELARKGHDAADAVPADGTSWERLRKSYPGD